MKEPSAEEVALNYKARWQVEQLFRDTKSVFDTRPVFHKQDETIRGYVFCSFLAPVLRKELDQRMEQAGLQFEWEDIKRDLQALQEVTVEESRQKLASSASENVAGTRRGVSLHTRNPAYRTPSASSQWSMKSASNRVTTPVNVANCTAAPAPPPSAS